MEFQHRLYELRKKAGLSQEELAGLLGVTRQAVQKWEAGTSRPDMDNLAALGHYFNVSLDWLITGREDAPAGVLRTETVIHHHYEGWRYEYKSRRTLFGLPLVHINLGQGLHLARGVLAIGNIAAGIFALGGVAVGVFAFGGVALAALALGGLALGLLAVGGVSLGVIALGGLSVGWFALGGVSLGVYAAGGVVSASRVAVGAVAGGPLAIGRELSGAVTLPTDGSVPLADIRAAIENAAGPGWTADLLAFLARHIK